MNHSDKKPLLISNAGANSRSSQLDLLPPTHQPLSYLVKISCLTYLCLAPVLLRPQSKISTVQRLSWLKWWKPQFTSNRLGSSHIISLGQSHRCITPFSCGILKDGSGTLGPCRHLQLRSLTYEWHRGIVLSQGTQRYPK
jgi:hypothetical protein